MGKALCMLVLSSMRHRQQSKRLCPPIYTSLSGEPADRGVCSDFIQPLDIPYTRMTHNHGKPSHGEALAGQKPRITMLSSFP